MSATSLPAPEKLDPQTAWDTWKPGPKESFDLKWAGHLHRRAGFGAGLQELRTAVSAGLPATLDRLLEGEPGAEARRKFLAQTGLSVARQNDATALRGWWLYALMHSLHPLREKMTLFWHDHFATSINKVTKAVLMYQQNLTLREYALGKFSPFLMAMSKDPAMLLWLDSASNVKGTPNENFAREVMELFSLGVNSGYTETDIREAARAFTGWRTDFRDRFTFDRTLHDDGTKTVLGQKGTFVGDDIVRICLEQPQTARFLVRKLYRYLISEAETPSDAFLEPLTSSFRESGYDIKQLVRRMLSSRHFFSAHAYRQKIKSPVEYALGVVWALTDRNVPPGTLVTRLEPMGQALFSPPNVKGWPGGQAWLNTSTVVSRHNFAQAMAVGGLVSTTSARFQPTSALAEQRLAAEEAARAAALEAEEARRAAEEARLKAEGKPVPPRPEVKVPPAPPPPRNMDVADLARQQKATTPEQITALLLELFLQGDVPTAARQKVTAFLSEGKRTGAELDRRIREAAHLIMTLPEYQLC